MILMQQACKIITQLTMLKCQIRINRYFLRFGVKSQSRLTESIQSDMAGYIPMGWHNHPYWHHRQDWVEYCQTLNLGATPPSHYNLQYCLYRIDNKLVSKSGYLTCYHRNKEGPFLSPRALMIFSSTVIVGDDKVIGRLSTKHDLNLTRCFFCTYLKPHNTPEIELTKRLVTLL